MGEFKDIKGGLFSCHRKTETKDEIGSEDRPYGHIVHTSDGSSFWINLGLNKEKEEDYQNTAYLDELRRQLDIFKQKGADYQNMEYIKDLQDQLDKLDLLRDAGHDGKKRS